jgi:protoheme IX farnesyltransferase
MAHPALLRAPSRGAHALVHTIQAVSELAKVRLSSLVLFSTAAGFVLGNGAANPRLGQMLWTLLGTALCAFGANAFNQWVEWPWDAQMARTQDRPIPSGRLSSRAAFLWAGLFVVLGGVVLGGMVNLLAAVLALSVAMLYVGTYTPLKRRSSLCTLVGAVCGAIPPMVGWAGAAGGLGPGAWVLFGVLFAWQIPHFLAIDWYYREDYGRGGFRMLSRDDPSGALSGRQAIYYCLALIPISLLAVPLGIGGWLYAVGALVLGLAYLAPAWAFNRQRTKAAARRLFVVSLAYLPVLLLLLTFDPTR